MFQFSSLLSKAGAEESRRRKSLAVNQTASTTAARDQASSLTGSADQCISDRVRRDLDEQMHRLADLLNRVESLDFEPQAVTADIFSPGNDSAPRLISGESSPTQQQSSCAGSDAPIGTDAAAHKPVRFDGACEVILSTGAVSNLAELAPQVKSQKQTEHDSTSGSSLAIETIATKTDAKDHGKLRRSEVSRLSTNGLVQDYPVHVKKFPQPTELAAQLGEQKMDSGQGSTQERPASLSNSNGQQISLAAKPSPQVGPDLAGASNTQAMAAFSQEYSQALNSPGLHILLVDETQKACSSSQCLSSAPASVVARTAACSDDPSATEGLRTRRTLRRSLPVPATAPTTQQPTPSLMVSESQTMTMLAVVAGLLTLAALAYVAFDLVSWH